MRIQTVLVYLFCSFGLIGCDACDSAAEKKKITGCTDNCMDSRQKFDVNRCINLCRTSASQEVSSEPKKLLAYCTSGCEEEAQRRKGQDTLYCASLCEEDTDGDGVLLGLDRCPKTPEGVRVAYDGCPDEDGDGIADDKDRCPQQGGLIEELDPEGCPAPTPTACASSYCAAGEPAPCQGDACLRELEVPLLNILPRIHRSQAARRLLSMRPHKQGCPGVNNQVPQPTMVKPPFGLTVIRAFDADKVNSTAGTPGAVKFKINEGKLVPLEHDPTASDTTPGKAAYQDIDIEVLFNSVEAPCPVGASSYALNVEYYFCDALPGIEERGHLEEAGFCRWLPLDRQYGIEAGKPFFYTLKLADLFAKLYEPHLSNPQLSYVWQDPIISFDYKKVWFKIEAIAYNGNGAPSASGPHMNASYLVVYTVAKGYQLSKIPGEGHD